MAQFQRAGAELGWEGFDRDKDKRTQCTKNY